MTSVEPKSGKLFKLAHGLFGPKWTEKWVHLDGHVLKYFSMASEQQPLFSLTSARQSSDAIELACYDFVVSDDKRITRKHAFHLIPKLKTAKTYVFACANERELAEWQEAFQPRTDPSADHSLSPVVAEKMRRAGEAFTACDPRRTNSVDASKLRVLLQTVGWQGDISEYSILQQQLDPNVDGRISRDQYLRVMKQYWTARDKPTGQSEILSTAKEGTSTPRGSFSDRPPRYPKRSEVSEPEVVSDFDPAIDEEQNSHIRSDLVASAQAAQTNEEEGEDASPHDWQSEFNRLLNSRGDDAIVHHGLELADFITKFRLEAERTTEEIIEEMALDDDARKIPSITLDDDQLLATDYCSDLESFRQQITKFAVRGLMVYVTHDRCVHKIFGNQLRAAKVLLPAIREDQASGSCLHLPLQCIVDYLGFRALVIAQPYQGCKRIESSKTLTAYDVAAQQRYQAQLREVCSRLGLFVEDLAGDARCRLDQLPYFMGGGAGVAMGAGGTDRSLVLQNTFDMFPDDLLQLASGGQKLRPEFVVQYGGEIPLCSELPSSGTLTQSELLKGAGFSAHEHLRLHLVPAFVALVEENASRIYDSATLTAALHSQGINVRYLGLCYEFTSSKCIKKLIWSEIIARACKQELRASLQAVFRDTVNDVRRFVRAASASIVDDDSDNANEGPVAELHRVDSVNLQLVSRDIVRETTQRVLLEFLNLVFGRSSADAHTFWEEHLLPRIRTQFVFDHALEELDILQNEDHVHWPQVIQAVQFHANISIKDARFAHLNSSVPFHQATAICITPRSKMVCRTTHECENLLKDGLDSLDMIKTQLAIFDSAPRDDRTLPIGQLLIAAAELTLYDLQLKEAREYTALAMDVSRDQSCLQARSLLSRIKVEHAEGSDLEQLMPQFEEAVALVRYSLGTAHPLLFDFYMVMVDIAGDKGDSRVAKDLLSKCTMLVRDCYGRHSLAYADIRRRQGETLVESGCHDEAMSILDEALAVYEMLKHELDPSDQEAVREMQINCATCIYLTAELQARQASPNALEIAFSSAVRAHMIREETLPRDHCDRLSSLLQLGELCVALDDSYRAQEYYRPALARLRGVNPTDERVISQLNRVTHAVLRLHLRSLPAEKLTLVDRVKKRFADSMSAFEAASLQLQEEAGTNGDQRSQEETAQLKILRWAMRQLLVRDPVEYINHLIEQTEHELQAHHRQRFASGTLRRDSAAEEPLPSPLRSPLTPSGSSRFASFAFGQPPQHASRPSSPLPQGTGVCSPLCSPSTRTSGLDWSPMLTTNTGEFTYGGQLAAVLFLAILNDEA